MPYNSVGSLIGADFNNTSSTQLFALGTHGLGSGGTEFVYCYFATGASAYKGVCITQGFTCTGLLASELLVGYAAGWTMASATNAEYGWVAIRGAVPVLTSGSVTATAQGIYAPGASGTTGIISNNYSASGTLAGIAFVSVAQTATATITGAILTWPRGGAPGQ